MACFKFESSYQYFLFLFSYFSLLSIDDEANKINSLHYRNVGLAIKGLATNIFELSFILHYLLYPWKLIYFINVWLVIGLARIIIQLEVVVGYEVWPIHFKLCLDVGFWMEGNKGRRVATFQSNWNIGWSDVCNT